MIDNTSLKRANKLIKKSRLQRKLSLYKMAFQVMIDKTIAVYLLILVGYLFASFFIIGDFINDYLEYFILIEQEATLRIALITTALPIRYIIQSFSWPGTIFSSSEYHLSILPYSKGKIWLLSVFEKWRKTCITLLIISLVIIVATPLPAGLIIKYAVLFMMIEMLMTIPQWKLYQATIMVKLAWLLLAALINYLNFIMNSTIITFIILALFIPLHYILSSRLFKKIDWGRVTEISDFEVWNMPIIAKASDVKLERKRKFNVLKNITRRKAPFEYHAIYIYRRLWNHYFGRNMKLITQLLGTLLLLFIAFRLANETLFYLGIAICIHVYTSGLAVFFRNQFETDLLKVLPWDLNNYKKAFFRWGLYGGILLSIPVLAHFSTRITFWLPFQLLFFASTFLFIYHIKIDKEITILEKRHVNFDLMEVIGYIMLICIAFSIKYPFLSLGFILNSWLIRHHLGD